MNFDSTRIEKPIIIVIEANNILNKTSIIILNNIMADIIKNLPTDSISTKEEVIQNVHINTPGSEEKIRKTLKKDKDRRKIIPYDNEDNNNVITINSIDNFRDISWINPIKIKKGFIYRYVATYLIYVREVNK